MADIQHLSHESLSSSGGFIFDSEMNCYMMWKQHEFGRWWRSHESLFTHPLSRTFINSVVDDFEFHHRLSPPSGFFKKKKYISELTNLAHFYGSGSIDLTNNQIVNGVHSLFSVGLLSYALEVFHQKRFKVRWNEPNPRIVQLTLDNNKDLPPPHPIKPFPWSDKFVVEEPIQSNTLAEQLTIKETGHLELDGERYMLMPASLLERFFSACLPHVPSISDSNQIKFPTNWSDSDRSVLAVIISSVVELFSLSERSVYISGKESWNAYLKAYLFDHGWGEAILESYESDCYKTTLTFPKTALFPFTIGLVAGIWERAHGRKYKLIIGEKNQRIQVTIRSYLEYQNEV